MNKIFWGFFLFLTFVITLPASWWILSKVDFGYGSLYKTIGISQHISRYAPNNTQGRMDFETTTDAKRKALFHGIVEAIHDNGKGLKALSYTDKKGHQIQLLTNAEIIHLKDVAILLEKLKPLVFSAFVIWLVILVFLFRSKNKVPATKQLLLSTLVIVVIVTAVLMLGPEKIFNQLHVWVFPDNHQWFFYYEDSLMSTMMKAPDLFAYIAAMLTLLSIVLTILLIKLLRRF